MLILVFHLTIFTRAPTSVTRPLDFTLLPRRLLLLLASQMEEAAVKEQHISLSEKLLASVNVYINRGDSRLPFHAIHTSRNCWTRSARLDWKTQNRPRAKKSRRGLTDWLNPNLFQGAAQLSSYGRKWVGGGGERN